MHAQATAPAGEYGEAEEGASEAGALDGTQGESADAPFGTGVSTDEVLADVRGLLASCPLAPWKEYRLGFGGPSLRAPSIRVARVASDERKSAHS